ncbi:MAG: hypothetical protein WC076_12230 [Terrimicrobiaceae bacterium]
MPFSGQSIADDTDQIRKYNSSGVLQSSWAAFEGPSSLIFNSLDGNLYATNMIDCSVGTYDGLGVYTEFVDLSTYDPTFFPVGIALDDFGDLYVSGGLDLDQIIKITSLGGGQSLRDHRSDRGGRHAMERHSARHCRPGLRMRPG